MPVQFSLDPGKPPVTFRFNVKSAQALEAAGGANPAYLAARGQQVTALILMVMHGVPDDPTMNESKARRLVQRYLDNGGKVKALMDALAKALNESGVYGDPDDAEALPAAEEDADETDPQTAIRTTSH